MKKIVMIAFVAASLLVTSCKGSTQNKAEQELNKAGNSIEKTYDDVSKSVEKSYEETKASVSNAFNDVKIPDFEDEKAKMYLNDYANHVKNRIDAGAKEIKNSEIAQETNNFINRSKEVMANLDDKAQKQFKETKAEIDAKWDEFEKNAKAKMND